MSCLVSDLDAERKRPGEWIGSARIIQPAFGDFGIYRRPYIRDLRQVLTAQVYPQFLHLVPAQQIDWHTIPN